MINYGNFLNCGVCIRYEGRIRHGPNDHLQGKQKTIEKTSNPDYIYKLKRRGKCN